METLDGVKRNIFGKQVRRLRQDGLVPAVVYGEKRANLAVAVRKKEFEKLLTSVGESTFFGLTIADGGEQETVIIHEVQRDPLSGRVSHVDFYRVNMAKPIAVKVPLEFVGESSAVTLLGGVLVKNIHEVEVEALPQQLPKSLSIDISTLKNFDDQISVRDIALPEGVAIKEDEAASVVAVQAPRTEQELETLQAQPETNLESIEVEKRGKEETPEEEGG
ncbi:MAG: 50S ribosomal protein L25 [bacterium]|nr:50S ribosomal protein L25 [bacterium]MDZ4296322.1 50S ribosomal protein L25 [Patescibacteria group bacterium]